MKILIATIILTMTSAMAIECTATKGSKTDRGYNTLTEKLKLLDGFDSKYEAEIEDGYFTFTKNDDGLYSAKIIMAPDYTSGVSTLANFDAKGEFTLAKIEGGTKYLINCAK